MPKIFEYPSVMDVAEAASDLIGRVRAKTIGDDKALDANQITGVASYLPKLVFGEPSDPSGPLIGSLDLPAAGAGPLPELHIDEAERNLREFSGGGFKSSGLTSKILLASLVAVLKAVAAGFPEPYGSTILAILAALGL